MCRIAEFATTEGTPVVVILIAPRRRDSTGAWRLLFQQVSAYRRLPAEAHAGAHHIALREAHEKRSLPTLATYEVVHSHCLQEAVSPNNARPRAVRHFVTADSYEVYDIAAEWYDVQNSAMLNRHVWTCSWRLLSVASDGRCSRRLGPRRR